MNSYLDAFLSYFFPDLALPAWLECFVGILILVFFFKVILAIAGMFGNGRN